MQLTKKYRIIYDKESLVIEGDYRTEYNTGSITVNTDSNKKGSDFDTLQQAENYVQTNELIQIENGNMY